MNRSQILIVEDESIVAMDIENALKSFRYSVLPVASSAQEAIQRSEESHPDLVLMDIRLKGTMDGIEAATHIRERFDIPVLYLTANADESTLQKAKKTQAFGYMLKPFEKEELHTAIQMALYKHQMERQLQQANETLEKRVQERTQELLQAEKLAAMGRMAAGLAHEFATPLSVIRIYADMALKDLSQENPLKPSFEMILKQSLRLQDMVQTLLTFSRKRSGSSRKFDVNDVMRSALLLVRTQAPNEKMEIRQELLSTPLEVVGQPDQIEQVFINLAKNALDAMPEGGLLKIKTRKNLRNKVPTVQIDLMDTGSGISPETREKMFDPFFTTKSEGKGTGLGLWVVHEIMKHHGGEIRCQSAEGKGTTFTLELPLSAS
jgi:two-component system, NtrC family, sensor kinase